MEGHIENNLNSQSNSRFNVVIRIRPILGDESNELTTEEDLYQCVSKLVKIFI